MLLFIHGTQQITSTIIILFNVRDNLHGHLQKKGQIIIQKNGQIIIQKKGQIIIQKRR